MNEEKYAILDKFEGNGKNLFHPDYGWKSGQMRVRVRPHFTRHEKLPEKIQDKSCDNILNLVFFTIWFTYDN